ncbi:hypothetical protein RIF29_13726 [Crotalaria pallida]|uniref:Uncharacterized protein n=1 Tax=Crotalaria pallida TaxID=3830 RepID=A0AAN9IPW5_CROPI
MYGGPTRCSRQAVMLETERRIRNMLNPASAENLNIHHQIPLLLSTVLGLPDQISGVLSVTSLSVFDDIRVRIKPIFIKPGTQCVPTHVDITVIIALINAFPM